MNNLIWFIILLATPNLALAQSTIPDTMVKPDKLESVYYYIDGIKVRGSSNLPRSAMEDVTVITGGPLVYYSDVNSNCIFRIGEKEKESSLKEADSLPQDTPLDKASFNLVPNPTSEVVEISLINDEFIGGEIILLSSSGNVLLILEMKENRELVDVSKLPSGSYFLSIEKNGKTRTETLIIE